MIDREGFFRALGHRVRELRKSREFSQEDMLSFGFSVRHWQQIEAGRPITLNTVLRICDAFEIPVTKFFLSLEQPSQTDARRRTRS